MNRLHHDRRGYTMTFWAVFIGFVLVPTFALAIELGRYFYAISEVAKAADAAAVAASAEINARTFKTAAAWCLPERPGPTPNPIPRSIQPAFPVKASMLMSPVFK